MKTDPISRLLAFVSLVLFIGCGSKDNLEQRKLAPARPPQSKGTYPLENWRKATLSVLSLKPSSQFAALQNLQSLAIRTRDARNGSVRVMTYLRAQRSSKLVAIIPGLGENASSNIASYLAEVIYNQGNDVVIIPSPITYEFVQSVSATGVVGLAKEDAKDLAIVLKTVKEVLSPKINHLSVVGYSMGALELSYLQKHLDDTKLLRVYQYVGVNPPTDLFYAEGEIARMVGFSRGWSESELEEILGRVVSLFDHLQTINPFDPNSYNDWDSKVTLSDSEAEYLLGSNFQSALSSTLPAVFDRLKMKSAPEQRAQVQCDDLTGCKFSDYLKRILIPYWKRTLLSSQDLVVRAMNYPLSCLRSSEKVPSNFALIHSHDDFLVSESQLRSLKPCFKTPPTFLDYGGHLGQFWDPRFQSILLQNLR